MVSFSVFYFPSSLTTITQYSQENRSWLGFTSELLHHFNFKAGLNPWGKERVLCKGTQYPSPIDLYELKNMPCKFWLLVSHQANDRQIFYISYFQLQLRCSMACCQQKEAPPSSLPHIPFCAIPSSGQLCAHVRTSVELLSAVTQQNTPLAKPPPTKSTMFPARLMNWTDCNQLDSTRVNAQESVGPCGWNWGEAYTRMNRKKRDCPLIEESCLPLLQHMPSVLAGIREKYIARSPA